MVDFTCVKNQEEDMHATDQKKIQIEEKISKNLFIYGLIEYKAERNTMNIQTKASSRHSRIPLCTPY